MAVDKNAMSEISYYRGMAEMGFESRPKIKPHAMITRVFFAPVVFLHASQYNVQA